MSSFLVEDATISRVVEYCTRAINNRPALRQAFAPWFDVDSEEFAQELGGLMRLLNCQALHQRYGDNFTRLVRSNPYAYATPDGCNDIGAYKSLHCWDYQCSEGNVPDLPIFRVLRDQVGAAIEADICTRYGIEPTRDGWNTEPSIWDQVSCRSEWNEVPWN